MARKNSMMGEDDEKTAVTLGQRLSKLILHLAARRGFNQATFAEQIGYSRASFNQIVNSHDTARLWRLPGLCAVSRVLGVPLSDLIRAAENLNESDITDIPLSLSLAGTAPRSAERLSALIKEAINSYPELDEILYGENYEALLGCRIKEIELGAPDFYLHYTSGKIGDPDALAILSAAVHYVHTHGGLGVFPLWAALKEEYEDLK